MTLSVTCFLHERGVSHRSVLFSIVMGMSVAKALIPMCIASVCDDEVILCHLRSGIAVACMLFSPGCDIVSEWQLASANHVTSALA